MLHHLVAYAENGLDSEPGFTTREVRWQVELDSNGIFVGVIPLGDGRRGQKLSRCPEMHAMNAGGRAHFLVESAKTVALMFKDNEERTTIESGTGLFLLDKSERSSAVGGLSEALGILPKRRD